MITPIRREALGEQVAQSLRELVVRGQLPGGSRLVEDSLAEQFGVSRGPIRDALRRLEAEGLIESRRRGYFVVEITADEIHDLYSLRESVEVLAIELAIARGSAEDWARGRALIQEMARNAEADDHDAFAVADTQFHALLYTLSRHRRLADVWRQYEPILSTLLRVTVEVDTDLTSSARDHEKLLALIESGDAAAATTELREHLHRSRDRMIDAWNGGTDRKQ